MNSAMVALSHLNSAKTLERCLSCLAAQDYPRLKVVVTDAGSTDGSIEIAQRFARNDSRFVFKLIPGCTEGGGEMWSVANYPADVILFTNSDIYTPPHWVSLHVAWHEKGYEMVGGKQAYIGDKYDFAWSTYRGKKCYPSMIDGMSLGFTNFSVSYNAYISLGGVDPSLSAGTDMAFFLKGMKAKLNIALDPRLEVYHDHPLGSFYWCFRKSFKYGLMQSNLLRLSYGKPWDWPPEFRRMSSRRLARVLPGAYWYYGTQTWAQQSKVFVRSGKKRVSLLRFLLTAYLAVGWSYQIGAIMSAFRKPSLDSLRKRRMGYGTARN